MVQVQDKTNWIINHKKLEVERNFFLKKIWGFSICRMKVISDGGSEIPIGHQCQPSDISDYDNLSALRFNLSLADDNK